MISLYSNTTHKWSLVVDGVVDNYSAKAPRFASFEGISYVYTMLVPEHQADILLCYSIIGLNLDLSVNYTNITSYTSNVWNWGQVGNYWGEPELIGRYRMVITYQNSALLYINLMFFDENKIQFWPLSYSAA